MSSRGLLLCHSTMGLCFKEHVALRLGLPSRRDTCARAGRRRALPAYAGPLPRGLGAGLARSLRVRNGCHLVFWLRGEASMGTCIPGARPEPGTVHRRGDRHSPAICALLRGGGGSGRSFTGGGFVSLLVFRCC